MIFILFYFFSNGSFPSGIFSNFFRAALFSEKLLLHTSLTTSTQQLLFPSICFFRAAAFFKDLRFRKSHFLAAVIFSEYLIFRNKTSTEQPYCKNSKFFRAVTFQNSYFLGGVIAWNKDIYGRAPLIKADTSTQNQHFQKSYIFEKPSFPGGLPF